MRALVIYLITIFCCLSTCKIEKRQETECFKETKTSFFDLRHGDLTKNEWIRKPNNLIMVHETLKKYGYKSLLNEVWHDKNTFIIQGIYIEKNIQNWLDSLILTYKNKQIDVKYYREFWQRRKNENNDSIVFKILKNLNRYQDSKVNLSYNDSLVNDTLLRLLEVEFNHDSITDKIAKQNFDTLVKYGFHQSAYNILHERYDYYEIGWNPDKLKRRLEKIDTCKDAWIKDNTK